MLRKTKSLFSCPLLYVLCMFESVRECVCLGSYRLTSILFGLWNHYILFIHCYHSKKKAWNSSHCNTIQGKGIRFGGNLISLILQPPLCFSHVKCTQTQTHSHNMNMVGLPELIYVLNINLVVCQMECVCVCVCWDDIRLFNGEMVGLIWIKTPYNSTKQICQPIFGRQQIG